MLIIIVSIGYKSIIGSMGANGIIYLSFKGGKEYFNKAKSN